MESFKISSDNNFCISNYLSTKISIDSKCVELDNVPLKDVISNINNRLSRMEKANRKFRWRNKRR